MAINDNRSYSGTVDKYIGTAYDTVKVVADDINSVSTVSDDIASVVAVANNIDNVILNNYAGDRDPSNIHDASLGYSVGSEWVNIDVTPQRVWRCTDASVATAEWVRVGDHAQLDSLTDNDQHPISAITGLQAELDNKIDGTGSVLSDSDIGVTVQGYTVVLDATTASYTTAEYNKLLGIDISANNYVHPTGGVDPTPVMTGATVFNDLVVDTGGHVTGYSTREMTPADISAEPALGYTAESILNKNVVSGYAGLNTSGRVDQAQLPSYVDTITEYANEAAFPGTGAIDVIYIALDSGFAYRWSGTQYIDISGAGGVTSVAGRTGIVTLDSDDITETTNLFYTDVRVAANTAVTLNTAKVSNKTHTGDVTGSEALTITAQAVSLAKMANIATTTIMGRATAGTGSPEALSVTAVRTLLNVEDGSTADQTGAEIKSAYEGEADTNAYDDTSKTKLDSITDAAPHIANGTGAHTASAITNVPNGNLVSTNQQDVNAELDVNKEPTQTEASQGEAEAGTESALRSFSPLRVAQAIAALSASTVIPSGTLMLFQQTAAPTGWTKQTDHNDKALRVVSGTADVGGSVDFSAAFTGQTPAGSVSNTTLATSQIPAHTHNIQVATPSQYASKIEITRTDNGDIVSTLSAKALASGGGGSHTHSFTGSAMNLAVKYVDLIIASKD